MSSKIQLEENGLTIQNLLIEDVEVREYFTEVKPEDMENRFRLAVKVGTIALKTMGTAERVDYIQKEFNKLDTKFNEILQGTANQLSENMNNIFGQNGTVLTMLETNFGEEGKVNSIMAGHLGENGTFSQQLEKYFGKNGILVRELFDPMTDGTPLNLLKKSLSEELTAIKKTIDIEKARKEERKKSIQKGGDFEDLCEELLDGIVGNHKGDVFYKTTVEKGQKMNSKKGDFVIDINGKAEYRIVIETKDWSSLTLPKINQEIEEALENRGAKYGIFVAKYNESLPRGVGCFNYYNDDRIVCSLGSKEDEVIHEEILHAAYCWARANILRKSALCEEVRFEVIDSNLSQIKNELDAFQTIKTQCSNIYNAQRKIVEITDEIAANIEHHIHNIHIEMRKGAEREIET